MLIRRSHTGAKLILSDTGLRIVRPKRDRPRFRRDFDPSQVRDASGKWTKGGGGVFARPSKTMDDHHLDVLAKKTVEQLKAIAKEVGAGTPGKNPHRKSAWIEEIQKANGNKQPTPQAKTEPGSPAKRDFKFLDHEELVASGKKFSEKTLKGQSEDVAAFEVLHQAIRSQSDVSKEQAMNMAKQVPFDLQTVPWESVQATRQHLSDFFELTGGRGATSISKITKTSDRAFANMEGIVNIGSTPTADVLFHEFAHHIEFEDRNAGSAAANWRNSRETPGTRVDKLSNITGNPYYRDTEVAVQDKFIDPYVGKVYPRNDKGKIATEVTSVGLEHFAKPELMQHLYKNDPQHFHFVVGLLVHK